MKTLSTLGRTKLVGEILQSYATLFALVAGGWWFYAQHSTKPLLKVDETVTSQAMAGDSKHRLVIVEVKVTNVGKVNINLPSDSGKVHIGYVNPQPAPLESGELKTDALYELSLEPGESDLAYFKLLKVSSVYQALQVTASYDVPGSNLIWQAQGVFDISRPNVSSASSR